MKDIILEIDNTDETKNNDLKIVEEDFLIEDSDEQNVALIFESHKGEFKENPKIGFGAISYLKSNVSLEKIKRDLTVELERDGYQNVDIDIDNNGKLIVDIS